MNLPHYVMHMFSTEPNVHRYNTRSNTIFNHPVTNLFGSTKCVRYHLPQLVEETDYDILEKWTRIAILDSVYILEKSVYKVTSLNATNQIVTRAKMYHIDMKYGCCMYIYFFSFCINIYILSFASFSFYSFLILFFSFILFLCSFTVLVPLSLLYLTIRTYKHIFGLFMYSAPDIARSLFSKQLTKDTHSSLVRARYGCHSWGRSLAEVLYPKLVWWVKYRVILYSL